jgi:hypothetical protein
MEPTFNQSTSHRRAVYYLIGSAVFLAAVLVVLKSMEVPLQAPTPQPGEELTEEERFTITNSYTSTTTLTEKQKNSITENFSTEAESTLTPAELAEIENNYK